MRDRIFFIPRNEQTDDEVIDNEEDSEYAGRNPDILVHNAEEENAKLHSQDQFKLCRNFSPEK